MSALRTAWDVARGIAWGLVDYALTERPLYRSAIEELDAARAEAVRLRRELAELRGAVNDPGRLEAFCAGGCHSLVAVAGTRCDSCEIAELRLALKRASAEVERLTADGEAREAWIAKTIATLGAASRGAS